MDSELPDHDGGPDTLEAMKQVTPAETSRGEDHPPERSEEERRRSRQANPGRQIVDASVSARERDRVLGLVRRRNGNESDGPGSPGRTRRGRSIEVRRHVNRARRSRTGARRHGTSTDRPLDTPDQASAVNPVRRSSRSAFPTCLPVCYRHRFGTARGLRHNWSGHCDFPASLGSSASESSPGSSVPSRRGAFGELPRTRAVDRG